MTGQYWGYQKLRPTNTVANVTMVLLGFAGGVSLYAAAISFTGLDLIERAERGLVSEAEGIAWDASLQGITNIELLLTLLTAIAFLIWEYRSIANLPVLGLQPIAASPSRAVVAWFIPLANFILPYLDIRDLSNRLDTPGRQLSWPILLWWIAWIAAAVVGRISFFVPTTDLDSLRLIVMAGVAAELLTVIAAVFAIVVVYFIQAGSNARASTLHPAVAAGY